VQAVAADALVSLDLAGNGRMTGTVGGVSVTAEGQLVPFERSVARFLDAVRAGQPGRVFCTPADAVRTLAVATAAEQALLAGRTVRVAIL
jgi:predicted dehydrogenase